MVPMVAKGPVAIGRTLALTTHCNFFRLVYHENFTKKFQFILDWLGAAPGLPDPGIPDPGLAVLGLPLPGLAA